MLHLIEVKNWSGELVDEGRIWRQIKRTGEDVEHANLLTDNIEKLTVVLEYLRDCGVNLDEEFIRNHICQKTIFMNPRLRLPNSLSSHPDIITSDKLQSYLDRQKRRTVLERMLCSVIDLCLESEASAIVQRGLFGSMSAKQFDEIGSRLARLSSWDQLRLLGTRIITGDLLALKVGESVINREDLAPNSDDTPQMDAQEGYWTRQSDNGYRHVGQNSNRSQPVAVDCERHREVSRRR